MMRMEDGSCGRDLRNLEALGYSIRASPATITLVDRTLARISSRDDDVLALLHIREAFTENHPLTPLVTRLLARLTAIFRQPARPLARQPALRRRSIQQSTTRDCADSSRSLETAISQRRAITFLSRARPERADFGTSG